MRLLALPSGDIKQLHSGSPPLDSSFHHLGIRWNDGAKTLHFNTIRMQKAQRQEQQGETEFSHSHPRHNPHDWKSPPKKRKAGHSSGLFTRRMYLRTRCGSHGAFLPRSW